jgi:hypothetical protein
MSDMFQPDLLAIFMESYSNVAAVNYHMVTTVVVLAVIKIGL